MILFRKHLIILTILILTTGWAWSQSENPGEPAQAGAPEDEGFSVSIDLRLGGSALNIIPGLSAIVGVPLSFGSDSVTLIPLVGFQYYFDVWTDVHNSYYVPFGLAAEVNSVGVGLEVMYYPPVAAETPKHLLSAAVYSEGELLDAGAFTMDFGIGIGPLLVMDPADFRILFRLNSSLILRYRL